MGLRFRKSIKICKGVRLNLGKTGASISVGGNGFRKTFHTSGKVTTSVGIPGTGIYWTESTGGTNNRRNPSSSRRQAYCNTETFQNNSVNNEIRNNEHCNIAENTSEHDLFHGNDTVEISVSEENINKIYKTSDYPLDWIEISNSLSPSDLDMEESIWKFCKGICDKILDGDIDTYLLVIEALRPLDDLLLYAGDFEFGTEASNNMQVEFSLKADEVFDDGKDNPLYMEYIDAVSIRVARDLFALLPISLVDVYVVDEQGQEIKRIKFNKRKMRNINYHVLSAKEIVTQIMMEK